MLLLAVTEIQQVKGRKICFGSHLQRVHSVHGHLAPCFWPYAETEHNGSRDCLPSGDQETETGNTRGARPRYSLKDTTQCPPSPAAPCPLFTVSNTAASYESVKRQMKPFIRSGPWRPGHLWKHHHRRVRGYVLCQCTWFSIQSM